MRPRKEPRESFGSTLKKDLMDNLRQLSSDTDIPISKLLDKSVELLLENRGLTRDKNRELGNESDDKLHIEINLSEDDKQ